MSNQLSWTLLGNTDNYQIQRAPDDGFGNPGTFADILESPVADPTTNVVHAAGIAGDFYRGRGTNIFGAGAFSTIVQKIGVDVGDICNIFGNTVDVVGASLASIEIKVTLQSRVGLVDNFVLSTTNSAKVETDSAGNFSFNLIRQAKLNNVNSFYVVEFLNTGRKAENVIVPDEATKQYKDLERVAI